MKHETQALHLAKLMQKHTRYLRYELTLPLVSVRSKKFKKLSINDVLLIGIDRLEFLLLDGDTICASTRLKSMENAYDMEVVHLLKDTIKPSDSKKYKNLRISFGAVRSKALEVGSSIDITHVDLEKVTLVLEGEKIAEGSLINVDEEIAIQIKKVN